MWRVSAWPSVHSRAARVYPTRLTALNFCCYCDVNLLSSLSDMCFVLCTVVLYTDSSWLGWRSRMDDRGYPLRKSLRPTCLHRDGQESRCRGNWRIWGFHAVIVCLHVQVEMKEIRNIVLHSNCLWWHQTIFYIAWSTNQIKFYPSIRIATLCIYCPSTTV